MGIVLQNMQAYYHEAKCNKGEFQRCESLVKGDKGPVGGWTKLKSVMTVVEDHIKSRAPPDNTVTKRREYCKFIFRATRIAIAKQGAESAWDSH